MLLLLEIVLTVSAWRNGWRGKALLPLTGALTLGFFVGLVGGLNGFDAADVMPVLSLVDLAMIGVLFGMTRRSPRPAAFPNTTADAAVAPVPNVISAFESHQIRCHGQGSVAPPPRLRTTVCQQRPLIPLGFDLGCRTKKSSA